MNKNKLGLRLFLVFCTFTSMLLMITSCKDTKTKSKNNVISWLNKVSSGNYKDLGDSKIAMYLGKSIDYTEIISQTEENGLTKYSVKVKITPYKQIEDVKVDDKKISELKEDYLSGNLTYSETKVKLKDIYLSEEESNCFIPSDEPLEIVLVLSEDNENGVTYESQVNFINRLLADSNILKNLGVFDARIRLRVKEVLVTP